MFGENVNGYAVPVLNEREVRAGAGILLFISLTVFWGAWHADILLSFPIMLLTCLLLISYMIFLTKMLT